MCQCPHDSDRERRRCRTIELMYVVTRGVDAEGIRSTAHLRVVAFAGVRAETVREFPVKVEAVPAPAL